MVNLPIYLNSNHIGSALMRFKVNLPSQAPPSYWTCHRQTTNIQYRYNHYCFLAPLLKHVDSKHTRRGIWIQA